MLLQEAFTPGSKGKQLWVNGLVSSVCSEDPLEASVARLLAVIEALEEMEIYQLWGQSQADASRRAQRCMWMTHRSHA